MEKKENIEQDIPIVNGKDWAIYLLKGSINKAIEEGVKYNSDYLYRAIKLLIKLSR